MIWPPGHLWRARIIPTPADGFPHSGVLCRGDLYLQPRAAQRVAFRAGVIGALSLQRSAHRPSWAHASFTLAFGTDNNY
jgi:hypothetical protein